MVTLESTQKMVTIERSFAGMEAYEDGKRLRVTYREVTKLDGEIIKDENKSYPRDFDFWKASELGQAIIGMIELDLAQHDPAAPRSAPEE